MLTGVAKKFKSSDVHSAIISNLPSYNEVRCQLTRHRASQCIPVPDPLCIPNILRTTLRGRSVHDDDVNKDEPFLMYSGQGGKLLVFCARTELELIHKSECLICDGTFEMAPENSYQLYTVHGFVQKEGMPLLWALLPNKTTTTYVEMFTAIRSALIASFGSIGAMGTFLTDFELAAINAITQTFPEARVKGCMFHFRQALMRKIQNEGLKSSYDSDGIPCIRKWLRLIMSMSMLPEFSIPITWNFLKHPPVTGLTDIDTRTRSFSSYVEKTWITGEFPLSLWSHYDNLGHRTTNLAEGWHNGLNSSFGMPHPSLKTFLDWLQKYQHQVQCRGIQLAAGKAPKKRSQLYEKLDEDIMSAKVNYILSFRAAFVRAFPNSCMWEMLNQVTVNFLSRVSYLVIGDD